MKLLVVAYDCWPRTGGIASCARGLVEALSRIPGVEIRMVAPDWKSVETAQLSVPGISETRFRPGRGALLSTFPLGRAVRRAAKNWRPDAVLNLLWYPDAIATRLAGLSADVPYFVVAHGVEVLESTSTLRKALRSRLAFAKRRVFSQAAGVFSVSDFTRELVIRECGARPENVHVVPNGVDSARFHPTGKSPDLVERFGLHGRRVLLSLTRLEDYKGVDFAMRGLAHVKNAHPDVVYLIGGEGPDRPRLERLRDELGLRDRVVFAGRIDSERIVDFHNLADCFVLLSRDDWRAPNVEGFGIVFLEAAACGKPSIAGASGGIGDAVLNYGTGWLVDPIDESAIARAMVQALEQPALLALLGRGALARAQQQMSWSRAADRIHGEVSRHVRA